MKLTRDKIQRMIERSGKTASGTGSGVGGGIIGNGVTPEYYNQNFELLYKQTVTSGGTTTTTYLTALPNEVVAVGTVTDETTGDVTVTSLIGPIAKNALVIGNLMLVYDSANNAIKVVSRDGVSSGNFYATGSVSALGYAAGGGGGGATALTDLVDVAISSPTNGQVLMYNSTTGKWYNGTVQQGSSALVNLTDVTISSPTNGQVLMYNSTTGKWYNGTVQQGSSAWSDITGTPTTIAGYGITDAKIQNGTITLGSNSITPLTSYTETDPTVPAWAKAASKPSYSFSELTSHPTTIAGYGITDAKFGSDGTDYVPITLGSTTKNVLISHQSLSGYLSTSGGTMTNTNLVTNMNADMLDGMHVVTPGTPNVSGVYAQRIPFIGSNYVMEVGRYLDFHTADGTGDFTTRLYLHENSNNTVDANGNSVMLPSGTGVLALTTDTVYNSERLGYKLLTDILNENPNGTFADKPTGYIVTYNNAYDSLPGNPFDVIGGNQCVILQCIPGNPEWGSQLAFGFSTPYLAWRSHVGSTTWSSWQKISAGNADKLTTARTIWGQPFDGTGDINGELTIGGGVLKWDSQNNALYVEKSDGTSASFYATGSVSALGFSAGTSAVDAMTFGYLTVNNMQYIKANNYTHRLYGNSNGMLVIDGSEGILFNNDIHSNENDIYTDGGNVRTGGGRLYLDATRYIYVNSSGTLYYYNGTSLKQIAFTN